MIHISCRILQRWMRNEMIADVEWHLQIAVWFNDTFVGQNRVVTHKCWMFLLDSSEALAEKRNGFSVFTQGHFNWGNASWHAGDLRWRKITIVSPSALWCQHLDTLARLVHASFPYFTIHLPPMPEPSLSRASFHRAKTNLLYLGVLPWGRSTWRRQRTSRDGLRRRGGDEVEAETEAVAFSLPAQGEDRPCFVKRFLPAELFSQYQSKGDHWEKMKMKIACLPGVPGGHLGI